MAGLDQLYTYRRAELIVFAERSAAHALQLLGRVPARVVIVARRRGRRFAEAALRPRVSRLDHIDAVQGFIAGRGRAGLRQESAGLAILDDTRLVGAMGGPACPVGPAGTASRSSAPRAPTLSNGGSCTKRAPPRCRLFGKPEFSISPLVRL